MTSPPPDPRHESDVPLPPARRQQPGDPESVGPVDKSLADKEIPPYPLPEAALGGADAVEKTTYVVGAGTEPYVVNTDRPVAHPEPGGGINVTAWIVGAIVVLIALIYLAGLFG